MTPPAIALGGLMPEQKVEAIEKLKATERKVAMVAIV